ncbi:MAG: bifunctional oligoribonuclease/PAP phosphatase NrnA [Desulfuromonadaceae bacterium]|nr:bifunctional oligoribonuclease/PAP phosphatase NrnA [Desulfuromonadaceae bacterium]
MYTERSLDFSSRLLAKITGQDKVLIITHDNPDPDALASAYALSYLIEMTRGIRSVIACGGVVGRRENRTLIEKSEIRISRIEELDLNDFDLVCMVDAQPGTGNSSMPVGKPLDVVIDHHPIRNESPTPNLFCDIRPEYGACATILFEYLQAQNIRLSTRLATAMFYAIRSETQDLGREWVATDRHAYLELLSLSNNRILFEIAQAKVPRSYFSSFDTALQSAHTYNDILVFNLYHIDHSDTVAEIADFLLRTEGIGLVLGMGYAGDVEVLSLRTDREDVFAGKVIRRLVEGIGTAGGHGMIAGGQIKGVLEERQDQIRLEEKLVARLLEIFEYKDVQRLPLI